MKPTILFVDDEPMILQAMRRALHGLRGSWNMLFAGSGKEGLEIMEREQIHIVISDMKMPEMSGLQFLTEAKRRYPQVIRMILSGQADEEQIIRSVGVTHQYLSKPCTNEVLVSTIKQALGLRKILADEKLELLVSQIESLPSLPMLYSKIIDELQSSDVSITRISDIVCRDPGMTTKMLQLVNSPFFGIRRRITNPAEAVAYLGTDVIQALVLSVQVFSCYDAKKVPGFRLEDIWCHSQTVAGIAKKIFQREGRAKTDVDEAFTAGILHDIGMIILANNLPIQYAEIIARQESDRCLRPELELEVFGSTHAEVGAYLLGLWGLPDSIVEATALHHRPSDCQEKKLDLLCAIHVANHLAHSMIPSHSMFKGAVLDEQYLQDAGIIGRLADWSKWSTDLAAEIARQEEQ
jgi:HD-like signal output (HDOD) protein/CheY-like chemotaxis protein